MNIPQTRERIETLKTITGASDRTGWMIDEVAFLVYALIKFYKPSLVLQIGHLWGKSALIALEALTDGFLHDWERLERGSMSGDEKFLSFVKTQWPPARPGKLISVDAFPYGNWEEGIAYLRQTYSPTRFEYVVSKSDDFFHQQSEALRKQHAGEVTFGIVDGDHSLAACERDLEHMASLGMSHILVDDTLWLPHITYLCQKFVATHPSYQLSLFNQYNGIALLSRVA